MGTMTIREAKKIDLDTIMEKDPAATSRLSVRWTYSGYKALCAYRYAHWLYLHGLKTLAHYLAYRSKVKTGVEIHPAAVIGQRLFIDHGTGLVVGETTEIGNDCVLYQGVTLGGTGKDIGKRHPTLEDGVMVSAGAKILGPVTVGKGSKIGAGSVVLKSVPPYSTVVGVPGRIVKQDGKRVADMDQILLPDPIMEEFKRLNDRIYALEKALNIQACRYSITLDENNMSALDKIKIEEKIIEEAGNKAETDIKC
ncbi:MAG: serine O-acetyltransferase [Clostridia bacterium]